MTPDQFSQFLRDPATGPYLDSLIADNRRIDAQLAGVPETTTCGDCDSAAVFVAQRGFLAVYRCPFGHTSNVATVQG